MSDPSKIRILMVDDHAIFRAGLRLLLEADPHFEVVGECARISEAEGAVEEIGPDLVLLDLNFEDGNGLDHLPQLAAKCKILVLTAETDLAVHEECLKAGANGLVSKDAASSELFEAMNRVWEGDVWFDQRLMGKVLHELTRPKADGPIDAELRRISMLSPREREVIKLVGEGLKNKVIAERLYISETTVRHHMTSILGKLEVSSRLELVVFAFRHGLAEVPERVKR